MKSLENLDGPNLRASKYHSFDVVNERLIDELLCILLLIRTQLQALHELQRIEYPLLASLQRGECCLELEDWGILITGDLNEVRVKEELNILRTNVPCLEKAGNGRLHYGMPDPETKPTQQILEDEEEQEE